jgi:modulator of FtsH protease HflK
MNDSESNDSEPQPKPFEPPPGRKIALHEDTGSVALSEALGSVFGVLKFIMLAVMIFFIGSGVFTVEPNEVAVVLRFGKPIGQGESAVRKPGLHFAFPYPVDEIVRIPIGASQTIKSSTGWYFESPDDLAAGNEPTARDKLIPGYDGYLLSADGNIIHARATLKYRVKDPVRYVFYFRNVTSILQNALNRALIHAAAEFPAAAALYRDKIAFREAVRKHFNESLATLPMGIQLEPLDVQPSAPLFVKDSFEGVNSAEQMASKAKLDAEAEAGEKLALAVGEARSIVASGMIRSNQLVTAIEAEARSFEAQLPEFLKDPDLWKRRIMADTFATVLTNATDKFFIPTRADGSSRELRIQLSREPNKPKKF